MTRTRITLDIDPAFKRRVRLAAARNDQTVSAYIKGVVDKALEEDLRLALSADDDPVLAELWDNEEDRVYDAP